MIYPHNFEQKIGFDNIRELLKGKCLSTLGKERVDNMCFSDKFAEIEEQLCQTTEFVRIIQEEDGFPDQYFFDVRPSLKKIRIEGTYLDEQEVFDLRRSLETINDIVKFLNRDDDEEKGFPYPHLRTLAGDIIVFPQLIGNYNPGGKLTVTFPKSVGQIPFNFPYKPSSQIDGGKNPGMQGNMSRVNGALYPFGYGLSYTTFEYTDLTLSKPLITPNEEVELCCSVTNTGKRAGDEVVQLYVRDVLSSLTTYEKRLAGFERVHLAPGESKRVTFRIDRKALELLNRNGNWVVEPGEFKLMIGASSEEIRLNSTLTVVEYGQQPSTEAPKKASPISVSTNNEQTSRVIDGNLSTAWEGNKGDYITFALKNGSKVEEVMIAFSRENHLKTDFEIQLSSGGGQFLTVYSGTTNVYGKLQRFKFKGTTASDLRLVLGSDRVGVAEVVLPQMNE
ncbi:MAG: hypothetical protein EOM31_00260 [Bacteroidia bacterium]|nr:hypothetical protein [Bacteroidia bacterium]